MSTIKASNLQHPDSLDPNLETNADGSVHANKLDADELTAGTINASGLNINEANIQDSIDQSISQSKLMTENTQTQDYTLQLSDIGRVVVIDSETDRTITIPNSSAVDFPIGSVIYLYRQGEGRVVVTGAEGVTVKNDGNLPKEEDIYVRKRATNEWVVFPSLWKPVNASGGQFKTVTVSDTVYGVHMFTDIGSAEFHILDEGSESKLDVLIVGGGGGGGGYGGGGGGGAVLHSVDRPIEKNTYQIVVGAGGDARPWVNSVAGPEAAEPFGGGSSSAFGLAATGGGAGGSYNGRDAGHGANGGGSGAYGSGDLGGTSNKSFPGVGVVPEGDDYTTVYAGNTGGDANVTSPNFPLAGGAGAGEDGQSQPSSSGNGGNGGNGVMINIEGNDYYWGGGGAGGVYTTNGTGGNGGLGGGGGGGQLGSGGGSALNPGGDAGSHLSSGGAGGANTGGGGGGGGYNSNGSIGSPGGSGIVIIRYPLEKPS